ncbi:Phosphatidylinositide phosphatase SAC2 [Fusarium oxysporum f. sp. albedinis]|nr:Phosphatidylinositide phosphatase SAC2 [Fusarium oxysporum f. sp. albedinis]
MTGLATYTDAIVTLRPSQLQKLESLGLYYNSPEPAIICIECGFAINPTCAPRHPGDRHHIPKSARRVSKRSQGSGTASDNYGGGWGTRHEDKQEAKDQWFGKLEKNYTKTDPMAVRHINRAKSCLIKCLGDPLCDMMLLLALTFGACTVTPHIDERGTEFYPTAKRKDLDMLAGTMIIRMLCVIPNRGFNNRGLLKLGWVEYNSMTGTRRRTPRTTELKLKSIEELYDDRKRLVSAMNKAEKFISLVFGSDDEVWVARCSSIIQDR